MAFKINNTTWISTSGIPWSTLQHNLSGNWYRTSKGLNTVYINSGTNTCIGNCCGVNLYRATASTATFGEDCVNGFWRNAVAVTSRVDFPNNGDNFNIRWKCS